MTVLACNNWSSNAELIADLAKLGYLRPDFLTLDPTYGQGIWWKVFKPVHLISHDIATDGVDFRHLPHEDGLFDAVAFDPPYVSVGGRDTTTLDELYARYGMRDAPTTPRGVQKLINDGLAECARVTKVGHRKRGFILVKCQDYVSSGKLFEGTFETRKFAESIGLKCVDRLEHWGSPRPQPDRTRKCGMCSGSKKGCDHCKEGRVASPQVHARRNLSTMFVFRKFK